MELTEKTLLSFRLDPLGFDPYDQELEVVRKSLLAQLGLKRHGVWLDLDLGSPEVSRVVAQVEAWVRVGVAEIGQASLNTRCAPDTEWVQLLPRQRSLDIEPEKCRAFRLPKVDIVGQQYRDTVFVSERFRQFCVDHRLGGLDFQWVPDRGKFRAQQWFLPLLLENLGRGLDDPWFCPETLAGPGQDQPDTPTERFGIHRFYGWQWCRPEGNRLLNLLPVGSGLETTQLCLPPRVRAEDLPDRPFACLWSRRESLCCNQVTYQLLLGAGLLAEVEAEGIVVAQGDALGQPRRPFYSAAKAAASIVLWTKKIPQMAQRPLPIVDMSGALKKLRGQRKNSQMARGSNRDLLIARLGTAMPENWLQVLTVTDGGAVGGFFIHSSEALLKNAELLRASLRQDEPDFPERYYPVGSMVTGDILCLDLGDRCSKEDAPVLLISHETLQMERCWPTIAAFVVDIANNKSS